jgi:hypothetical protein
MNAPWRWIVEAGREWGWRHTAIGAAVGVAGTTLFNYGSIYFTLLQYDGEPLLAWALWNVTQFGWPYVFAMRVADRAVDEGHTGVLAYGLALCVVLIAGASVLAAPMGVVFSVLADASLLTDPARWPSILSPYVGVDYGIVVTRLVGYGLCTAIYVQWRQEKKARERLHAALAARAERERQVQAARLLALQARVEPQFLFATLQRVRALIATSTQAAQGLLDDLIALLRTLQGTQGASASSVGREFALVQAFGRTSESPALTPPRLSLDAEPAVLGARLAPLVLLPALRALTAAAPALDWRASAASRDGRLQLRLAPAEPALLPAFDVQALGERLAAVHGSSARIEWQRTEGALQIDVPLEREGSSMLL